MAGMIFDLEIQYEDQDAVDEVRADQRDMVAFETKYRIGTTRALDEMTVTFLRYIGWHAMRRLGHTKDQFEEWEKTVTSVSEPEEQEDGEGEDANPTNPAP